MEIELPDIRGKDGKSAEHIFPNGHLQFLTCRHGEKMLTLLLPPDYEFADDELLNDEMHLIARGRVHVNGDQIDSIVHEHFLQQADENRDGHAQKLQETLRMAILQLLHKRREEEVKIQQAIDS